MNARGWLAETSAHRMAASVVLFIGLGAAIGLGPVPRASMDNPAPRAEIGHTTEDPQAASPAPIAPTVPDAADRDGDCEPQWAEDLFCLPGLDGTVYAAVSWNDGTGEALYVGGSFAVAECATIANIARWDGSTWTSLGSGTNSAVHALTVFDDGSGPALYAGGEFWNAGGQAAGFIARWDGTDWSPLGSGMNNTVRALTVFDDGGNAGPALYAAGDFSSAGAQWASRIARWDGSAWSLLGSGMNNAVYALKVFDDGSGPALYAGGAFNSAGGQAAGRIACWNGSAWSPVGSGLNHAVSALTVFDDGDGAGPALYAGGTPSISGGNITRWDGSAWSPLGAGMNGSVLALTAFDDGSGPALYAGGSFTTAGGQTANRIARWNGSAWSALKLEVSDSVYAMTVFDDGSGPALYAGGDFTAAGGQAASRIARWNGSAWSPLGSRDSSTNDFVLALTVFDDGSGPALFAGGSFTTAGGQSTDRIARWDGLAWSPLGSGLSGGQFPAVNALATFDDGSGPALYAAGRFTTAGGQPANFIARWDGSDWSPLGSGVNSYILALTVFDDGSGPAIYAGGSFTAAGGQAASRIARWDGSNWSPLGSGLSGAQFPTVHALTVFDDGSGPALYAAGGFTSAGGQSASRIARWDGSNWTTLDSGVNREVHALTVFDDGSGPALYAGGSFTAAGGQPASHIARWDGSAWSQLGSGIADPVRAMTVFDEGSGPALYAGGVFLATGSRPANHIARWDGSSWSSLRKGMNNPVYALTVLDEGRDAGPALYAGGDFTIAGGNASAYIAKWQSCPTAPTCPPDLNADGLLNFFDLAAFLNLFQAQDPTADWNNDSLFNFFDFSSYLNAFNAGCP